MKNPLFVLLFIFLVSACSSQPSKTYKAAKGAGYGYTEKSLGENHYRVEFKLANSNLKRAEDYALLRAAELTTAQGYDWFEVRKRYSLDEKLNKNDRKFDISESGSQQRISRNCGLLGCRTQVHNMPDNDVNDETLFPDTTSVLEISFGKGIRPAKPNVYDAIETSEILRSKF